MGVSRLLTLTLASVCALGISASKTTVSSSGGDDFSESLSIQPLQGGYVSYQFEFTTKTAAQTAHYELFPRPVAQLAAESGIDELYVTLTQGRWLRDAWGPAPHNAEAPQGAEMWAWWQAGSANKSLRERWSTLRNAASGLLCASLNTMGDELSAAPSLAVQAGVSERPGSVGRECLYGALPKEATCTENLTPWVRLLPCRDRAGVGALLNPLHLYGVPYHAMALRVLNNKADGTVVLRQTLTVVKKRSAGKLALSDAFALLPHQGTRPDPRNGVRACPLASTSTVTVAGTPEPYDLVAKDAPVNVVIPETSVNGPAEVTAHRFFTGSGQVGGGFRTVVRNTHESRAAKVVLFQAFPFFVRPYFSSLTASLNGAPLPLVSGDGADAGAHVVITTPSNESATAATLEVTAEIPPASELTVEISFETVFLHFMRHPPDANRGWDLPAGIVVVLPDNSVTSTTTTIAKRLCTEELLLSLPTPDFSMPYNVITFSCTVVALFYGALMSMSTRRMNVAFKKGSLEEERLIMRTWRIVISIGISILLSIKNVVTRKIKQKKKEKAIANGETPDNSDDENEDDDDEMDSE